MTPEDTGYHAPVDLAARRAKRRVRADGRVPSDFAPIDYAADPSQPPEPIEGPGLPWQARAVIGAFLLSFVVCAAYGVYRFIY